LAAGAHNRSPPDFTGWSHYKYDAKRMGRSHLAARSRTSIWRERRDWKARKYALKIAANPCRWSETVARLGDILATLEN
jgi:hypothetical protein